MTREISGLLPRRPDPPKATAEAFFAERKGRGDREAAIRFLTRAGGEPPQAGDEMPD